LVRLNVSDPNHNRCWLPKSSADGIFGGLGLYPRHGTHGGDGRTDGSHNPKRSDRARDGSADCSCVHRDGHPDRDYRHVVIIDTVSMIFTRHSYPPVVIALFRDHPVLIRSVLGVIDSGWLGSAAQHRQSAAAGEPLTAISPARNP